MIAPRRTRIYIARGAYPAALLLLICTAWLVLTGTQIVRDVSDLARFANLVFQILAPLQLALAVFFSAMLAASAVAQEKDRKTFVLLLLTNLSNQELVLGKLMASLLQVLVMFAAGLPVFMLLALLGGISAGQIARTAAVTVASILVCGSLGSTLALWREKTFQALALFVLLLVLWLALGEMLAGGALGTAPAGISAHVWATAISPWQAVLVASRPDGPADPSLAWLGSLRDMYLLGGFPLLISGSLLKWLGTPICLFLLVAAALAAVLNGLTMFRVRIWNASGGDETAKKPEEEERERGRKGEGETERTPRLPFSPSSHRAVWDNPVLWREIRTWAYGRKVLIVRLTFLALFVLAAVNLWWMAHSPRGWARPRKRGRCCPCCC